MEVYYFDFAGLSKPYFLINESSSFKLKTNVSSFSIYHLNVSHGCNHHYY
jgi:hypothetical protein